MNSDIDTPDTAAAIRAALTARGLTDADVIGLDADITQDDAFNVVVNVLLKLRDGSTIAIDSAEIAQAITLIDRPVDGAMQ